MSNLAEHLAEQDRLTALCESGECGHAHCLREYDERRADENEDIANAVREGVTVHYFVREWHENHEFPEVHLFATEEECRAAMIAEAVEAMGNLGGWLTEYLDGEPITEIVKGGYGITQRLTSINVQQEDGSVDMFKMSSQTIKLEGAANV